MAEDCSSEASSAANQKEITSEEFFYKVLLSLHLLMGTNPSYDGSKIEEVCTYMGRHFCVTGDLHSQIEHALYRGIDYGLIYRKRGKFLLLAPAARFHIRSRRTFGRRDVEKIQQMFQTTSRKKLDGSRSRSRSRSPRGTRSVHSGISDDKSTISSTFEKLRKHLKEKGSAFSNDCKKLLNYYVRSKSSPPEHNSITLAKRQCTGSAIDLQSKK